MNKKAYLWWQYMGAAILVLITLAVAVMIMRQLTGRSFNLLDMIFG
jgi:hypothetical protein